MDNFRMLDVNGFKKFGLNMDTHTQIHSYIHTFIFDTITFNREDGGSNMYIYCII